MVIARADFHLLPGVLNMSPTIRRVLLRNLRTARREYMSTPADDSAHKVATFLRWTEVARRAREARRHD